MLQNSTENYRLVSLVHDSRNEMKRLQIKKYKMLWFVFPVCFCQGFFYLSLWEVQLFQLQLGQWVFVTLFDRNNY